MADWTNLLTGLLGAGASIYSANQQSNALQNAASQAAQQSQFRPVGITTRFGSSGFQYNPITGQLQGAGYQVAPDVAAMREALLRLSGGQLSQAQQAQAMYPYIGQAAQGLFGLGLGYLGQTPQGAAQNWMSQQQQLLAPGREQELARLTTSEFNRGTLGLGVGATREGYMAPRAGAFNQPYNMAGAYQTTNKMPIGTQNYVPPIADDSGMFVPPIADDSGMFVGGGQPTVGQPGFTKPAIGTAPAGMQPMGRPVMIPGFNAPQTGTLSPPPIADDSGMFVGGGLTGGVYPLPAQPTVGQPGFVKPGIITAPPGMQPTARGMPATAPLSPPMAATSTPAPMQQGLAASNPRFAALYNARAMQDAQMAAQAQQAGMQQAQFGQGLLGGALGLLGQGYGLQTQALAPFSNYFAGAGNIENLALQSLAQGTGLGSAITAGSTAAAQIQQQAANQAAQLAALRNQAAIAGLSDPVAALIGALTRQG